MQKRVGERQSQFLVNIVVLVFLLLTFVVTAYDAYRGYASNSKWKIGDWLINYQGGFIRRGLPGEVFLALSSWTGIPPGAFAAGAQTACYFFYFLFAGLLLTKQKRPLRYLLLVFSPFIFLFQVHDFKGGFRKEIIYFALLAFFAWASACISRDRFERLTAIVLLSFPLVILSHEMLAVFLPYIVAVYIYRSPPSSRSGIALSIFLSISALTFALTVINPGDPAQVSAICNSLADYAPKNCNQEGAIGWLQHNAGFGFEKVYNRVSRNHYLEYYLFAVIMSAIAYLPILGKLEVMKRNKQVLGLVAASILGSIPLFFVAVDWGRFIYIHLVSLFLLSLVFDGEDGERSAYLERVEKKVVTILGTPGKQNKIIIIVLTFVFFLGYTSLWHIPHSAGRPFVSNQTVRLADFVYKRLR